MKKQKNISHLVLLAVLISFSVILSLFDKIISQGILISTGLGVIAPYFKLGLANIVILIIIYNYNFSNSILSVFLKCLILAIFNLSSAPMSFGGSFLSFFVIYFLYKITCKDIKYIYIISAIGGFSHSLGQIIFGFLWYGLIDLNSVLQGNIPSDMLIYAPFMLITGLITGFLIGAVAKQTNKYFIKINK